MRCTKTYDKENKKPVVHQYLSRVKDWLCLIDAHIVGELFFFIIVSLWYNRNIKIVKERIEGGANEKAALRLFINCPFVCINFDFFWLNKARQLYMDF